MDLLPLIPSELDGLPPGCLILGSGCSRRQLQAQLDAWRQRETSFELLLLLAATRTAEWEGISAAGATAASRRLTALADADLLLNGPGQTRRWPLPPLPAGVSPALLSHVALQRLPMQPQVAAVGLEHEATFPHLRLESPAVGPARCVSTGQAMEPERVKGLWQQGMRLGAQLRCPLLLAECVPGGTTTAQAVLTGLGVSVQGLISGSARQPPQQLKQQLVEQGLQRAQLSGSPSPQAVLAAVGDPFQAVAAGVLISARQPLLLGGGSQMAAVVALALASLPNQQRQALADRVLIGSTAWLAQETISGHGMSALGCLLDEVGQRFGVSLAGLASGVRFHTSRQPALRDYEDGFVKEGVGAGGLLLLAQLQGHPIEALVEDCDRAMDQLLASAVASEA
ncbi:MAG: TIGR00303 family protein [Synechococcus sp.]|mgnify:FL=1|jgi:uncharacterized protein (TIGR00303 family)|nr:TIGR00303 family protein [Synechococcus sp.]